MSSTEARLPQTLIVRHAALDEVYNLKLIADCVAAFQRRDQFHCCPLLLSLLDISKCTSLLAHQKAIARSRFCGGLARTGESARKRSAEVDTKRSVHSAKKWLQISVRLSLLGGIHRFRASESLVSALDLLRRWQLMALDHLSARALNLTKTDVNRCTKQVSR